MCVRRLSNVSATDPTPNGPAAQDQQLRDMWEHDDIDDYGVAPAPSFSPPLTSSLAEAIQ
jgi:hypothetical protein